MIANRLRSMARRLLVDHGMLLVLALLCVVLSLATDAEQHPTGESAARQLAGAIADGGRGGGVVIVVRDGPEDAAFAAELGRALAGRGLEVVETVRGQPADARRALDAIGRRGERVDAIACNRVTASWKIYEPLRRSHASLADARVRWPESYRWPNFLKAENLRNIANQIAVIAILAIGMTLVILTGGIDLSVGSLIALSAVVTSRLIRDVAGAESATAAGMTLAAAAGVLACSASGVFSGLVITLFRIPPFIATLAMMLVASGLAFILADGQSIDRVPDAFIRLGRGADVLGVPNAVVLMLALYALAHLVMTRTVIGRYIYAVGGNPEAARLSGLPVRGVIVLVYAVSAGLAGLGGVIMASQLKSGAPTYGQMYELYVIAAVVVGGTSLSGGEGRISGTLVGALIIAVIQNGMNLRGVQGYTQKIVLGLVILGAVLLDRLRGLTGR